jgi:hypothetical protein
MFRTLTLMAIVPAALLAQSQTSASAATATSVEAEIAAARAWRLPEGPIVRRVEEGRAKGATEAQLAIAAHKVRLTMEGAHSAMVSAGRMKPSDDEIEHGGSAMERGYTREQLQAVVKSCPSDRSLVVAFDVLTRLNERGVPVAKALAQVQAKLETRQSDADIGMLVQANPRVGGVKASATATTTLGVGVGRKP